jgi:hypothetical protein
VHCHNKQRQRKNQQSRQFQRSENRSAKRTPFDSSVGGNAIFTRRIRRLLKAALTDDLFALFYTVWFSTGFAGGINSSAPVTAI